MAVPVLIYGSNLWSEPNKKWKQMLTETAESNFFRSVAGHARKDQININIRELLKFFYMNNKILKSRSKWKHHVLRMENRLKQKPDKFAIFDIDVNSSSRSENILSKWK
jgi:hypothetical protein